MNRISTASVLAATALLVGCASTSTQPIAVAGQAKQVIVCTVKPDVDPATVLAVANEFAKLPDVQDVAAGYESKRTAVPATQPARTVTFILTFRDEGAMVATLIRTDFITLRDRRIQPFCNNVSFQQTTLQNYLVSKQFTDETDAAVLQRRAAAIREQNDLRQRTK